MAAQTATREAHLSCRLSTYTAGTTGDPPMASINKPTGAEIRVKAPAIILAPAINWSTAFTSR